MPDFFSKRHLYALLFVLCVSIPYLNNYELTFALWSFTALVTLQSRFSLGILKLIGCYVVILSMAIVVFFFREYKLYFVLRDITYLLKPILGILIGYQIGKKVFDNTFKLIIQTGLIIAVIHIVVLAFAVIVHHARTVNDLRLYGGYFSDFEVYAVILLAFHKKFDIGISQKMVYVYLAIIGFSAAMYLARTNFVQFIILFLAIKGYFRITARSITVVTSVLLFIGIGYTAIYYSNPKRNGQGIEAMLYKIKIAPAEAFKTRVDRDDWREFNDNYRSYENIMTVDQMSNKGLVAILFGDGIGSQVDLKQRVWLGDMELRYISFLHNGFMTVLLKSGLFGLLFYFTSIYLIAQRRKTNDRLIYNVNLLLLGTGVFMVFSTWVFMGVYNLLDSKTILIGLVFCYREIKLRESGNNGSTQVEETPNLLPS